MVEHSTASVVKVVQFDREIALHNLGSSAAHRKHICPSLLLFNDGRPFRVTFFETI